MLETARDVLSNLRSMAGSDTQYVENVWALRYPDPSPKASHGWPYRPAGERIETPSKVIAIRP
jgi:hypothetical protein